MTFIALLVFLFAQQSPLRIIVIEGEGAVNVIQQKTAVAPVVEVRDQNNLPVANAIVRFTMAGGKQATFAGGVQTITVTTDAAGRAAAAINPLTNGAVQIQVQASFQGQTASATITQTNVMTATQSSAASAPSSGGGSGVGITPIAVTSGIGVAAAAAVLTAKSNDDSVPANNPAVQAALGMYVLQTVNGAGLPATTVASPPAACPVITDNATLTLTANGMEQHYELSEHSRTDCSVGSSESFQSVTGGTWSVSGTTITFTPNTDNFILDAATLSGSTLTMTVRPPHIEAGKEAPRVTTVWRK